MTLAEIPGFPDGQWEKKLPRGCLVDRDEAVVGVCRGRRALHLGAADWPMHEEKASRGELLHQKVRAVAASVVGLDRRADAVETLRKFGIDDIVVGEATDAELAPGVSFDVVLCCDIIEHVDDPGRLLETCQRWMGPETELVVTTINALSIKPALRALWGREAVHHEHVAYYSFGTLCQMLVRHGLDPRQFGTFNYPTVSPAAGWLFGGLTRCFPGVADGILVVARRS